MQWDGRPPPVGGIDVDSGATNAFEAPNFAVTAVPEPASIALMLAGPGMFGFIARNKRRG